MQNVATIFWNVVSNEKQSLYIHEMNHTRLLHQEAVKKPKHSLVGVLTCLIFLFRIFFCFFGERTTVNCQLFGAFHTTSRVFSRTLRNSPRRSMDRGSGLAVLCHGQRQRVEIGEKMVAPYSMEFPGFLENLFVQLGGKVLNLNIWWNFRWGKILSGGLMIDW